MKPHIKEAYRYIDNAKTIIKEKLVVNNLGYYNDPKYVKAAGNYGYLGVLEAFSPFVVKKKGVLLGIDDYKISISKLNKKMVAVFVSAYHYLHLLAGYDGDLNKTTLQTGLEIANKLIEWADQNTTTLGTIKK